MSKEKLTIAEQLAKREYKQPSNFVWFLYGCLARSPFFGPKYHVKYKVTKISRWTSQFNNQRKLKYLVIGANVVLIDDEAFAGCPELVSVTGGARLRAIGTKAFERCPKLKVFNITSKTLWKIGPLHLHIFSTLPL